MDDVSPGFVAVGRVVSAFGVRGEVKVRPLADPTEHFFRGRRMSAGGRSLTVRQTRHSGPLLLVKFGEIEDRNRAEELRDLYLEIPETDLPSLPEDQYYSYKLVGLRVLTMDELDLGVVREVMSTSGSDVLVIDGLLGEVLVPVVDDFVREIDIPGGTITVEVVPGMLPPRRSG